MKRGIFIIFEGIDGAGLTTQATLLERWLIKQGFSVILTKEPTDGLIGGLIKAALRNEWKTTMQTLQLLFAADRAHHLHHEIIPALKRGNIVISDRYYLSTIAYGMTELDINWLISLNSQFLSPDLVFILDVSPEVSLKRISESRFGVELFERKRELEKVRENFKKLCREFNNCFMVDGERDINEIHSQIVKIVERKLKRFKNQQ